MRLLEQFLFLILPVAIWADPCRNAALDEDTEISIAYQADGTFTVSTTDLQALGGGTCSITLTNYDGDIVNPADTGTGDCDSTEFVLDDMDLDDLVYGNEFTFTLEITGGASDCLSTASITPAVCTNALGVNSVLGVSKAPHGKIKSFVTKRPPTGECAFYLTEWNGVTPTTATTPVLMDCSSAVLIEDEAADMILHGTNGFGVKMVSFESGANIAADQPLCGLNEVAIIAEECADTSALSLVDRGLLQLDMGIDDNAFKCVASLVEWLAVDDVPEKNIRRQSADCSTVQFDFRDVAMDYGHGDYTVEFAKFNAGDNVDFTNPVCSYTESVITTAHVCDDLNVAVERPDPNSLQVSIDDSPSFGVCKVELTFYNGLPPDVPVVRTGPCDGVFNFIHGESTEIYGTGDSYQFAYTYYEHSDLSGIFTCESDSTGSTAIPIYDCDLQEIQSHLTPDGSHSFSIESPAPLTGSCRLKMDYGVNTAYINFPGDCSSSVTVNWEDVDTAFTGSGGYVAGEDVDFSYQHKDIDNADCDSTPIITQAIRVRILLEQSTEIVPGEITVDAASILPAGIDGYEFPYCVVYLIGCDGTLVAADDEAMTDGTSDSECEGNPVTFTENVGENSICQFELRVWESLAAFGDLNLYGGTSGVMTFSASGLPDWGDDQSIEVFAYGDDCLEVTWPVPSASGGSAVICYEVSRRDASGEYYVIHACDTELRDQPMSVISCSFTNAVDYAFKVRAQTRIGSDNLLLTAINVEDYRVVTGSELTAPDPLVDDPIFVAGAFPVIEVAATGDDTRTDKLFAGRLVNQCSGIVDSVLLDTDATDDVIVGPLGRNAPPAFTSTFTSVGSGVYQLIPVLPSAQPAKGKYSIVTYSLERGGLFGQYFTNPFLVGEPEASRKDPIMDFAWGLAPIIDTETARATDLISIRWTGFIEAKYSEVYTIAVETDDHVRVWIDDVLIINAWDNVCDGSCSDQVSLTQSTSNSRKFHHIRIEYYHSKGVSQLKHATFGLYWSSEQQPYSIIPASRIFKGAIIDTAGSPCRNIEIVPDVLSPAHSIATHPITATAGIPFNVLITAMDKYGNRLDSTDSVFKVESGLLSFSSMPVDDEPGLYYVPVTFDLVGTKELTITSGADPIGGSSGTVIVSPASAYKWDTTQIEIVDVAQVAGIPFTIRMEALDEFDNLVTGDDPLPDLFVSAAWIGDDPTSEWMTDISLREQRYGDFFTHSSVVWNQGLGKYDITMMLPFRGDYEVEIGFNGGWSEAIVGGWEVVINPVASGVHSIVITEDFPPSELTVGVDQVVVVKLRDAYINTFTATPGTGPTVAWRLSQNTGAACSDETDGTYECTISADVSGTGLMLSIIVNGAHVSYLADDGLIVRRVHGPWAVDVAPGILSPADCIVLGVRSVYTVDVPDTITIVLKDVEGNSIGAAITGLDDTDVLVHFDDGMGQDMVFNSDGTITVTLLPSEIQVAGSLVVQIYGEDVSGSPFLDIDTNNGPVSAEFSTCADIEDDVAGGDVGMSCQIKDAEGNSLTEQDELYLTTFFRHSTDSTVDDVEEVLAHNLNGNYIKVATSLTRAGEYTYYTVVGQPGGLLAQYYANDDFTELIDAVPGTRLSDARYVDGTPVEYTRIDQVVDFDWAGAIYIGGVEAKSVRWSGYWDPSGDPDTDDDVYPLRITAYGGVTITVDSDPVVELISETLVFRHQFAIPDIAPAVQVPIEIKYVPRGGSSLIHFRMAADPDAVELLYVAVPPSALQAPLAIPHDTDYTVSIAVADVSTESTATMEDTYTVGVVDKFIIQPKDMYLNSWTEYCGDAPDNCVFETSIVVLDDDGDWVEHVAEADLNIDYTDGDDGVIDVEITFPHAGLLHVMVKYLVSTGPDVWEPLVAAPFPTQVNLA